MRTPWIHLLSLLAVYACPAFADGKALREALGEAEVAYAGGDEAALDRALRVLVDEDGSKPAKGLLELVEAKQEPASAYWQIVYALGALEDERAIAQLERWLKRNGASPLAADLASAWSGNPSPALEPALTGLLGQRKLPLPVKLVLVDRLAERATPSAVDALFALWEDAGADPALAGRVRAGLVGLLGDDMGGIENFASFWEANRARPLPIGAGQKTGTAVDGVDPTRRAGLKTLTKRGGRVIVLRGPRVNYDEVEAILARMKIKHEVMQKKAFMADLEGALRGTAVVLLNCNWFSDACVCPTCKPGKDSGRGFACGGCEQHEWSSNDRLTLEVQARLRTFVLQGGSVFTEDWGLWELANPAWPKLIAPAANLEEQTVDYYLPPGSAGDPLLRGVLQREGRTITFKDRRWTVDAASPAIKVLDKERVRVLLASRALSQRDPEAGALAVLLEPTRPQTGGGRPRTGDAPVPRGGMVLHVLSHFGKQAREADEFALQNLLINFVLEAQSRYARRER